MGLSNSDAAFVYSIRSIALVAAIVASAMSVMLIAKVSTCAPSFAARCLPSIHLYRILLLFQHLRNFRRPTHQSKIVGILWMVPIYSVNCVLSLWFPQGALFIDLARDCYEVMKILIHL